MEKEAQLPKKQNVPRLVLIAVILVALMIGGGTIGSLITTGKAKEWITSFNKKEVETILVPQAEFLVNLQSNDSSLDDFLKIEMSVETTGEENGTILTEKAAIVRDAIISVLRNKSTANIFDESEGVLVIKQEIILKINQSLGSEVASDLYITNIVMQ
ncbi:flagellar basal body-associated FliL family protein [Trichococcus sp. K1Tr]|uniref:flagellar basal body-associated FliL family protein n=1 Tax=Trichococcus sp. K1Tr TaxID=3020847 RepID=UPI00232B5711|nr:flagellar basal body-associated FliL family protein [Trichococcus sp. K1Tr]MDB6353473.1 flagellar basal body-associated FliL family protein [Trichococcus sp. K1Tr]